MKRVDRCRGAAREAVADVGPPSLTDRLYTEIETATMTPAVLTLASADAVEPGAADRPDVVRIAAGTQLIYDGLRLTRELAHGEPWANVPLETPRIDADLAILAADVLVARGFSLLAHTDAAAVAVETVRAFGRDQTERREVGVESPDTAVTETEAVEGDGLEGDGPGGDGIESDGIEGDAAAIDARLERDVLDLAIHAGAAAVGGSPDPAIRRVADDLFDPDEPAYPPVERWLGRLDAGGIDRLAGEAVGSDRATSASDR